MPMSKSEIAAALAEQVGITKKQVNLFFEAQAALAYKHAKEQFVIPGIGKLKVADKAARDIKMTVGSAQGADQAHREKDQAEIPDRPLGKRRDPGTKGIKRGGGFACAGGWMGLDIRVFEIWYICDSNLKTLSPGVARFFAVILLTETSRG